MNEQNSSNEGRELLTVAEVAALAQHLPQTVTRWIREGRLPARRYGRKWLISRADWDEFDRQAAAAFSPQQGDLTLNVGFEGV